MAAWNSDTSNSSAALRMAVRWTAGTVRAGFVGREPKPVGDRQLSQIRVFIAGHGPNLARDPQPTLKLAIGAPDTDSSTSASALREFHGLDRATYSRPTPSARTRY